MTATTLTVDITSQRIVWTLSGELGHDIRREFQAAVEQAALLRLPVEFDLACAIAHLALARQPIDLPERLLDQYCRRSAERLAPDGVWLARFAACEAMRRLIGVAQLPIPPSDGFRAALLGRSRDALLNNDWRRLWDHA